MSFSWIGGYSGETLPGKVFTLRYNVFSEVPLGTYQTNGKTQSLITNKFSTRYRYRSNSVKAYINGVEVSVNEDAGALADDNIDFLVDIIDDGYLHIEYLPEDDDIYYSDTVYTTQFPTRCENRALTVTAGILNAIKNAIVTIETHMASDEESYLYTDKIRFIRDRTNTISEVTREEIVQYQDAITHLGYLLDRTTGITTELSLTDITLDNSYYLKDKYIMELRQALASLDTQYGITE